VVTFFANGFLRVTGGLGCKFDKCHGSWADYGLDVTGYEWSGLWKCQPVTSLLHSLLWLLITSK